MPIPILTTKLFIPPPPVTLIPRPRLIEKINQGLNKKLTIISAPAGFGKTTLLSDCVSQCSLPVAWYSLDEGDNDLSRFLTYLITTLQTINHEINIGVSRITSPPQFNSVEPILTELLNQITRHEKQFVLVLDDYHVIESLDIDLVVSFIVSNMPPPMHLVIASRTDPTFPLSRLRSQGELIEIRVDDMRFSPEEVTLFLEDRMGLNISAKDAETLESRTEGWIAGLQLAALSMQQLKKGTEITQFVQKFSSSNRFVLDYLTDEVLEQRPTGTKDFLLQTSILERLSGSLCNAVTGVENGQEILEALEAANLFIVPLDDERVWYRYHHLFGDLLQARLRHAMPDLTPELHRRASTWYETNDLMSEAIAHSLTAKDFERATQLTEQTFFDRMSRGEDFSTMMTRLVTLPENIIQTRPFLGIMYAWMLSITLQLDQVEPRLADIETRFGEQLPAELQRQIASIRAEVFRHRGEYQKAIESSLQILKSLPEEPTIANQQTYTGLVTNLAWGYVLAGDLEQAQKWFNESMTVGKHSITLTLLALFGLAWVQEFGGQLKQAIETCLHGLQLVEETSQKIENQVPAVVYMHLRLGNLLREQNQLVEAEHHLTLGLDLGYRWHTLRDTMKDGYLDLARLRLSQYDFEGALDALSQAEKLLPQFHSVRGFGDLISAHKARVRLVWAVWGRDSKIMKTVESWAEQRDFLENGLVRSIHEEFEYLVWVRLLLTQNQFMKALSVLERLIDSAKKKGRIGRMIEMRVLQALVHQKSGDYEKGVAALTSALTQAEPEGYVRLFLDEGPPMEELLRRVVSQDIATDYVNKLLHAFKPTADLDQPLSPTSIPQSPLGESLSVREIEVLHLLADGATNQEIAGKLIIAVTTAKKHVSNIIGKLGVSNRTQAVARARDLNLI